MSEITLKLQISESNSIAGELGQHSTSGSSGTAWMQARKLTDNARRDEVMLRLFDLRGAIESIKADICSPSLSENRSQIVRMHYGHPIAYEGIVFRIG